MTSDVIDIFPEPFFILRNKNVVSFIFSLKEKPQTGPLLKYFCLNLERQKTGTSAIYTNAKIGKNNIYFVSSLAGRHAVNNLPTVSDYVCRVTLWSLLDMKLSGLTQFIRSTTLNFLSMESSLYLYLNRKYGVW